MKIDLQTAEEQISALPVMGKHFPFSLCSMAFGKQAVILHESAETVQLAADFAGEFTAIHASGTIKQEGMYERSLITPGDALYLLLRGLDACRWVNAETGNMFTTLSESVKQADFYLFNRGKEGTGLRCELKTETGAECEWYLGEYEYKTYLNWEKRGVMEIRHIKYGDSLEITFVF